MIKVRELVCATNFKRNNNQTLIGKIVLIGDQLRLIDNELCDNWKNTPFVVVELPDLKFALMLQVAQMGGESIFFHDAKIFGRTEYIAERSHWIIVPNRIEVRDSKNSDWKIIDFGASVIDQGKTRYAHLDNPSDDQKEFWGKIKGSGSLKF